MIILVETQSLHDLIQVIINRLGLEDNGDKDAFMPRTTDVLVKAFRNNGSLTEEDDEIVEAVSIVIEELCRLYLTVKPRAIRVLDDRSLVIDKGE